MADNQDMATHVDDILRALGKEKEEGTDKAKAQKERIEKELREYIDVYRVKDLATAKRSIVRKHGGNPADLRLASGITKTLAELTAAEMSVDFVARVLTVNPKEIEVDGEKRKLFFGIVADPTGSRPYTAWMGEVPFAKGDVFRFKNAYTKEWNKEAEISFGGRTTFEKLKDDALPATPVGRFGEPKSMKVVDFQDGVSNVTVDARIISVERREVTVGDERKSVFSGLLADETGRAQFSMWHDFALKPGEAVRISGAYIKAWKGIPRLTFDERSKVERLEKAKLPDIKELKAGTTLTIEEIATRGGAADATIRGIIIDVKPGSGLVLRCPDCKRVVQKGACRVHGNVKGSPDLRIKAALDDGTGAIMAILSKELTERITGKKMEDYMRLVAELANPDAVRAEIMEKVIARPIEITGNVTADDYGLMLIATSARMIEVDVQAEARAMLEQLEVG